MKHQAKKLLDSPIFEKLVAAIIILNSIVLGLETSTLIMGAFGTFLKTADRLFLAFFVTELILKIHFKKFSFFRDPWNVFDFVIIAIALIPSTGSLSVLRAFRIFRLLRLLSVLPKLRKVVTGLLAAVPSLGAVVVVLSIFFYVWAVLGTKLFGDTFPEFFGTLGKSGYSLFQIMTLESWSMGIARPVINAFPFAWIYFISFIMLTTFTVMNLVVAVIVSSMQAESEEEASQRAKEGHEERLLILKKLEEIESQLRSKN